MSHVPGRCRLCTTLAGWETMSFEIASSDATVEFWSDSRLQYEPKGEMRHARDELRAALKHVAATGELFAEYASTDPAFCDVENVLFYNVGTTSFAALARRRLRFQRSFASPAATPSGAHRAHQHRYETRAATPVRWRTRRNIGERRFQLPTKVRATTIWAAARAAATVQAADAGAREVGLEVRLVLPTNSTLGLHSSMKALLDGIIASFHRHDGSGNVDDLSSRVAAQLGVTAGEARGLLLEGPAELGPRRLVHAFGRQVQWNPADDWLVTADLCVERVGGSPGECTAMLVDVERT